MSAQDTVASHDAALSEQEEDDVADETPRAGWEGSEVSSDEIS